MGEIVYALCFYRNDIPYQLQASPNKERLERTMKRMIKKMMVELGQLNRYMNLIWSVIRWRMSMKK